MQSTQLVFLILILFEHLRFQGIMCFKDLVLFRRLEGMVCPVEDATAENNVYSLTKCMLLCTKESTCRGVVLESDTSKCVRCSADSFLQTNGSTNTPRSLLFQKREAGSLDVETVYGNTSYRLVTERYTWSEAKHNCEQLGGYLTSVKSAEEQTYIENFVGVNYGFGVWIGGNGTAGDASSFRWLDSTYVFSAYVNWHEFEPSEHIERKCMKIEVYSDYEWTTKECTYLIASVCKFE